jgi:outer membrane protein TolC
VSIEGREPPLRATTVAARGKLGPMRACATARPLLPGYFVAIGLVLASGRAAADPQALRRLELAEALERAEAAHPSLGVPRARVRLAEAKLSRAKAAIFPRGELLSVVGIINGARVGEVPEGVPEALAPLFSEDRVDNLLNDLGPFTRNTLRLTQPLFTFGKIENGVAAARGGLEAREADVARQKAEVRFELKRIYYGYQLADRVLETLRDLEKNLERALERASERVDEGEVGPGEALKLRIGLERVRRRGLRVERERAVALLAFRRALGRDLDAPIAPALGLEPVEIRPLDQGRLGRDLSGVPGWRAALAGLGARRRAVDVAESQLWPDIFLGVQVEVNWAANRDDVQNPFLFDPFNLVRGGPFLGLRWQLDFGDKLAALERARARVAEQAARVEEARRGLPLAIRSAMLEVQEKEEALASARESRKAGRALSFLSATNFRLGLGEAREVLEALETYAKTYTDDYRAIFDYDVAVAGLSKALGYPVEKRLAGASPPPVRREPVDDRAREAPGRGGGAALEAREVGP